MKLIKPAWISHGSFAIYAVDIHPDGTRFASGGGDSKVRIWAMGPLNNETDEQNEAFPKQLAALHMHMGPVNCVRWSNDGKYLASCGDDSVVMLWQCSAFGAGFSSNLGEKEPNHENWRVVTQGKGHESNIQDLAWAPDSTKLASCSTDNTIIVWDVPKLAKLAVLRDHQNFVVGISWDPLGKYLASQSNDKSMILWSCTDWKMEHKVEEPFKQTTATTFFRRPSWSPDGSLVCAAHGKNGTHNIAAVVARDKWNVCADFVGHSLPVVVARFNPCIFQESGGTASLKCMVGSQDGTFSVWSTASPRPKVRVHSIFNQTIEDAAWTKNGRALLVCSADGTVVYCVFDELELGTPLSPQEHKAHLKKLYGDAMIAPSISIVEDPSFINPLKGNQTPLRNSGRPRSPVSAAPVDVKAKQVEQITKTGKRRITPVLLHTEAGAQTSAPSPFYFNSESVSAPTTTTSSSSSFAVPTTPPPGGKSASPVSKQASTSTTTTTTSPSKIATTTSSTGASVTKPTAFKPVTLPTTTPTTTTTTTTTTPTPASTTPSTTSTTAVTPTTTIATTTPTSEQTQPTSQPSASTTPNPVPATTSVTPTAASKDAVGTKRKELDQPETVVAKKLKKKSVDGEEPKKEKKLLKKHKTTTSSSSSEKPTTTTTEIERIIAPPMLTPAALPTSGRLARMIGPQGRDGSVEVRVEGDRYSVVTYAVSKSLPTRTGWDTRILGRVVVLAANANFVAVGCEDGTIHVFSPAGRLLLPPMALTAALSFLEANQSDHLMAITTDGLVTVWNITRFNKEVAAQQLPLSLISQNTHAEPGAQASAHLSITHAWIGDNGQPVVTSGHMAFAYHLQMGVWLNVASGTDTLSSSSSSSSSAAPSLLSKVSTAVTQNRPTVISMVSGPEGESLAALEAGLASAQILGSVGEYKHWLHTYTRRLVEGADVSRLQELCGELLGPPGAHATRTTTTSNSNTSNTTTINMYSSSIVWDPTVVGIPKRELLKEILPIMSTNRSLQRLVAQYREMLVMMSDTLR